MVVNPLQDIVFLLQGLPLPPLLATRMMTRVNSHRAHLGRCWPAKGKEGLFTKAVEGSDQYELTGTQKTCMEVDLGGVKPRVSGKGGQNIRL